jgi:hypothetical protein
LASVGPSLLDGEVKSTYRPSWLRSYVAPPTATPARPAEINSVVPAHAIALANMPDTLRVVAATTLRLPDVAFMARSDGWPMRAPSRLSVCVFFARG